MAQRFPVGARVAFEPLGTESLPGESRYSVVLEFVEQTETYIVAHPTKDGWGVSSFICESRMRPRPTKELYVDGRQVVGARCTFDDNSGPAEAIILQASLRFFKDTRKSTFTIARKDGYDWIVQSKVDGKSINFQDDS